MKTSLVTLAAVAVFPAMPARAFAAAAPMIIEQTQARELPAGSIPPGSLIMDAALPFTTGVEHYTRTIACGGQRYIYVARCLSLERRPPPAGSIAIYDPEGWALTSPGEQADYCAAMRLAARLVHTAHAHLVIAPPSPEIRQLVQCAAQLAPTIILQAQPHEADTATYMHVIRQAARWARTVRPSVRIAFVLSTASRYGATPDEMIADYQQAQTYLGGAAWWWLNIIPDRVNVSQPVATAEAVLAAIS